MPLVKDFKEFAIKGNVIDLAVAVIIGAAFGKIVTSLVNDIIMPPIGLALGKVDFKQLFLDLSGQGYATLEQAKAAGAPTLNYGILINTVLEFLIVALVVFFIVRAVLGKRAEAPAPTRECPYCVTKIALQATRCPACTSEVQPAT